MKSTMINLDENTINKNLKLPKSNKNINQMWDFINERKKQQILKKQLVKSMNSVNNYSKQIENIKKNPSLGPEYIRKNYSSYLPKDEPFNYDNRFKNNYTKKYFGSVLLAMRIRKEDDSNKYDNVKNNKFTQVSKLKMKWKTIKWIFENKKDVLDRLMGFHESILKMTNKKSGEEFDKGMTKQEFLHVMRSNGITNDVGLINKIFWMFDEDGDNHLKYKEIAFGIEMFRESSIEKKLKAFFDLCDVDNSGTISKQEFLDLMKKNIINNDEKLSIKQVVDKIFNSVKLDKNGEMTL
jgi:Ca2+-binding EF-hand superfamily protein